MGFLNRASLCLFILQYHTVHKNISVKDYAYVAVAANHIRDANTKVEKKQIR